MSEEIKIRVLEPFSKKYYLEAVGTHKIY